MAERVAIIDYGSGNLRSVEKAFERAAREAGLACRIEVTGDPAAVAAADRIVLPGVGAYAACMAGLEAVDGMIAALEHKALVEARPFLGVCVGMQLLSERGLEFGETRGLGWIPGEVRAIAPSGGLRVPHMGWNEIAASVPHPALKDADGAAFYFLHSFHFVPENDAHAIAFCTYGEALVAAVARDNIIGVQFHPEKSQDAGIALIAGFLGWRP